ncbi:type II secretion system protein [Halonatronum saccharophilum]|uniref:type II secretion system protein n=1 Tax=Halonatronum saccharophilum TaxID=150060 RepID=UPI000482FC76|nr:type II secretion system protein [Halonatronum saccharophilum]
MKGILKREGAFTLIEILIALSILGLISGASFTLLTSADKAIESAKDNWMLQNDLIKAGEDIIKQVKTALYLEIGPTNMEENEEEDSYIFLQEGAIVHRQGEYERVIIDNDNLDYNINFRRIDGEEGNQLRDLLEFELSIDGREESITTAVMLANLPKQMEVIGTEGNAIYYLSTAEVGAMPATELSGFCFIATAAFGSPLDSSVVILREFRDQYLLTNNLGSRFVDIYYYLSPPLANLIADNDIFRFIVRVLLMPIVFFTYILLRYNLFGLFILFLLFAVLTLIIKRARLQFIEI